MNNLENEVGEILRHGFADQDLSNNEKVTALTHTILNLIEQQVLSGRVEELHKALGNPRCGCLMCDYIADRTAQLKSLKERG